MTVARHAFSAVVASNIVVGKLFNDNNTKLRGGLLLFGGRRWCLLMLQCSCLHGSASGRDIITLPCNQQQQR